MESWFIAGTHPKDYEQGIDTNITYNEKNSGYLKPTVEEPEGFATLMQMFRADAYRSKRMRFSAAVKAKEVEEYAGLWMRLDGFDRGEPLGFDNMRDRPIKGTIDWQRYEVVLDVPQGTTYIAFGINLKGKGQVWLSNVHFEEVGTDIPVTSPSKQTIYPDQPGNLDFLHGARASSLRSADASTSIHITFQNTTTETVHVYWINYQGKEVFYRDLGPAESYIQQTYITHPWCIKDDNGRVLKEFVALKDLDIIVIS